MTTPASGAGRAARPDGAPPDAPAYPRLFSPITLAGRRLRNRIAHASISTILGAGQRVTEPLLRYYGNRARGGAAMIVTEPLAIAPHQRAAARVCAWNDSGLDGLARWADAVEREDCRLLGQVQDAGRGRHIAGRNDAAIGAAALPDDLSWTMPHVLSIDEIARFVDSCAQSAARLARCGFSGVELSAGHGHLFHQFMSPWSNDREDRYGGDFDGRLRIVVELLDAIRSACGGGFIVGVKMPGDDGVAGGIGIAQACTIAQRLAATGQVDYLCLAQGSHHRSLEMHTPDDHWPRLPYLGLTRSLRDAVPGVPVMALGRVTDPAEADAIVARGDAALVGIGRALITDPGWPVKAAAGRARDIRYCVAQNHCWHAVVHNLPIACDNNPRVAAADELDWLPPRAPARRRVVVVGAGIAGLEAAWIAAARGHEVTVLGRSSEVGGKARMHAALPGSESLASICDYQLAAAIRAGVRLQLGAPADLEQVLALRPDAVVLATGATMTWPRAWPAALRAEGLLPDLRTAIPALLRHRGRQPGAAVVLDMDHTEGTYSAVELLAQRFERVVLVTPRDGIAHDVPLVTRQGVQRRLFALGVQVHRESELRIAPGFADHGRIEIGSVLGGPGVPVEDLALLTYATPRRPDDALLEPLRAAGIQVLPVGDCVVARTAMAATADGNAAGLAV